MKTLTTANASHAPELYRGS